MPGFFGNRAERAEVIELFPQKTAVEQAQDEKMLAQREGSGDRLCWHRRQLELDVAARRVYCRECGVEVPAFEALDNLRRDVDNYLWQWERAVDAANRAEERLAGLERREKNTKARIRTAKKKAGPTSIEVVLELLGRMLGRAMEDLDDATQADRRTEIVEWLEGLLAEDEDERHHLEVVDMRVSRILRKMAAGEE